MGLDMTSPKDELDLFSQEVQDVSPISSDKVDTHKSFRQAFAHRIRQSYAVSEKLVDRNMLTSDYIELLKSNDILAFKRDGVQHGVYKKLRMGKYQIEARLDLHKKSVEEARVEVFNFIEDCYRYELRTLLILHGKGDRNPDNVAMLKSYIAKWLPELDVVLAFHSAQPFHGGTGAVYVLLKKGVGKKLKTKEEIQV